MPDLWVPLLAPALRARRRCHRLLTDAGHQHIWLVLPTWYTIVESTSTALTCSDARVEFHALKFFAMSDQR
jgi:hypothetical protein